LEALPATPYCVACAEELAAAPRDRDGARPVEEERLSPPFARTWRGSREEAAFDGEDAWQAVARYGTSDSPPDAAGTRDPGADQGAGPAGLVEATDSVPDRRWEPGQAADGGTRGAPGEEPD